MNECTLTAALMQLKLALGKKYPVHSKGQYGIKKQSVDIKQYQVCKNLYFKTNLFVRQSRNIHKNTQLKQNKYKTFISS